MQKDLDSYVKDGLFASRYKIKSVLGAGGMGKVFLAEDTVLENTLVALKVLKKELCNDEVHLKRFLREVQLTRQVTHPNVVRTFDVGLNTESIVYFTMEYSEGVTIDTKIEEGVIEHEHALIIIKSIADGLTAIHGQGIIHRDLKPSNVILNRKGVIQIMDFGVAKPNNSNLTEHSEVVGSSRYLAPEAWTGKELSAATDIYALGIMAYEMLAGFVPFEGKSPAEIMYKHLDEKAVSLKELNLNLPNWLCRLINQMIEKDPLERPQSASEVLSIIEMNKETTSSIADSDPEINEYIKQASMEIFDVEIQTDEIDEEVVKSAMIERESANKTAENIRLSRKKSFFKLDCLLSSFFYLISFAALSIFYSVFKVIGLGKVYGKIPWKQTLIDYQSTIGRATQSFLDLLILSPLGTSYQVPTSEKFMILSKLGPEINTYNYQIIFLVFSFFFTMLLNSFFTHSKKEKIKSFLILYGTLTALLLTESLIWMFILKKSFISKVSFSLYGISQEFLTLGFIFGIFNWLAVILICNLIKKKFSS